MAPSATYDDVAHPSLGSPHGFGNKKSEYLIDRNVKKAYPIVIRGQGCYLYLADGRKIFDASAGAAVSAIGHGNSKVIGAMKNILETGAPYVSSSFWAHEIVEELCEDIIEGTNRKMSRVYLTGSGKLLTLLS